MPRVPVPIVGDSYEDTVLPFAAQQTINAIMAIKGVVTVVPVVADIELSIAEERVRRELTERLFVLLSD